MLIGLFTVFSLLSFRLCGTFTFLFYPYRIFMEVRVVKIVSTINNRAAGAFEHSIVLE
jgi:hypothetical protein